MTLRLHNTLTKQIDSFTPTDSTVLLYTCGPTVYDYLHVGNWAAYIYWDILVRTLHTNDMKTNRVLNITDVGHLVSDEDSGQDKLEKGAEREQKTAWEIAEFYAEDFLNGIEKLGLVAPEQIVRATDFIDEQLELVRTLRDKGVTYEIDDGIYFDTASFPQYATFAELDLTAQQAGARIEHNEQKHNPADFALWKFTQPNERRDMEWETPIDLLDGDAVKSGFPGWHLECSAMAMNLLGPTIDIHTGGIDHIPVHHTNEIAQSETATGQQFSRFWLHNNHLKVDGTKISKSLGNGYTLQDLHIKGFTPLDFRMFVLQGHYRSEGNFTFENLTAAKNRLNHWRRIAALRHQLHSVSTAHRSEVQPSYAATQAVIETLNNDLATPDALRVIDETFTIIDNASIDTLDRDALITFLESIDELLGLQLLSATPDISDELKQILLERQRARENNDWSRSDVLRDKLLKYDIVVHDTKRGSLWSYSDNKYLRS